MNIFKKIGSFASNSWKDFSEYYDQQPLNETETMESQLSNENSNENSFELKKRVDAELLKKGHPGFFRKRFSKKKLLSEDPRSPTTEFQRTPIQIFKTIKQNDSGILSPFNVQDMLASVDSAIVAETPTNDFSSTNPDEVNDENYIENANDWKDFKYNEKILTESLIVEVSTLDINSDLPTEDEEEGNDGIQINNHADDHLEVEKLLQQTEQTHSNANCKIIDYVLKGEIDAAANVEQNLKVEECPVEDKNLVVTSTPKKTESNVQYNEEKKVLRTPLVCIRNSPMVNKCLSQTNSTATKQTSEKIKKKKKINTVFTRQLSKVPSTPLTPLFKPAKNFASQFDKENY